MTDREVEIYHSVLYNIESYILESGKDILKILKAIDTDLSKNEDLKTHPKKDSLCKIIKDKLNYIQTIRPDKDPHIQLPYKRDILEAIRNERKPLDQRYLEQLINPCHSNDKEALEQAKAFAKTIKESDPKYYNTFIYRAASAFRKLPNILKLTNSYDNQYFGSKESVDTIKKAKDRFNYIITDYKLEHTQRKKVNYAIRYINRTLFSGFINRKEKPKNPQITFKDIASSSEQSIKLLKEQLQENNDNAKILITCLEYVMKEEKLEKSPFPILINTLVDKLTLTTKNKTSVPFFIKDKNLKKETIYIPNSTLTGFYRRALRELEPLSRPLSLKPGIKYRDFLEVDKDPSYLPRICDATRKTLINLCKQYDIDESIVHITFNDFIFDKKGNIKEGYEKTLFNWLTTHNLRDEKGSLKDEKNEYYGPLFVKSKHHDKEQINFSEAPNSDPKNLILTLPLNSKAKLKIIFDNLIDFVKHSRPDDKELINALNKEKEKTQKLADKTVTDIHDDILHGGNLEITPQKDSEMTDHFYLTPAQPKKQKKTKEQDTQVVAIIDTGNQIYDKSGKNPLSVSEKIILTANHTHAIRQLRDKGR